MQGQQDSSVEISVTYERKLNEKTGQKKEVKYQFITVTQRKVKKLVHNWYTGTNILLGKLIELFL